MIYVTFSQIINHTFLSPFVNQEGGGLSVNQEGGGLSPDTESTVASIWNLQIPQLWERVACGL